MRRTAHLSRALKRAVWRPFPRVLSLYPTVFRRLTTAERPAAPETAPNSLPSLPTTCSGCGVTLQAANEKDIGFFKPPQAVKDMLEEGAPPDPANAVENWAPPVHLICQRCHRAKHYGNLVPVTVPYAEFKKTLNEIIARPDAVMVVVLDVTDVHGTVMSELTSPEAAKRMDDIVFAVNKVDLLPKSAMQHMGRLDVWMRTELRRMGLPSGLRFHFISSTTGRGVRDLMADVQVGTAMTQSE